MAYYGVHTGKINQLNVTIKYRNDGGKYYFLIYKDCHY